MEVIGGLHTNRAIKSLIENEEDYEDNEELTTRTVRLYAGLNSFQCMKIGYDHNVASQTHRATTFEEYCKMFRKELRASIKDKYPNFEVVLKCILMVFPYLLLCSYKNKNAM